MGLVGPAGQWTSRLDKSLHCSIPDNAPLISYWVTCYKQSRHRIGTVSPPLNSNAAAAAAAYCTTVTGLTQLLIRHSHRNCGKLQLVYHSRLDTLFIVELWHKLTICSPGRLHYQNLFKDIAKSMMGWILVTPFVLMLVRTFVHSNKLLINHTRGHFIQNLLHPQVLAL